VDQATIETQILCCFGQGGKVGFGLWTRRYQGNQYSNNRVSLVPMSVYVGILFIQIYPLDIYRERERVYQYNLTYFL
jgi:hypothetical protein